MIVVVLVHELETLALMVVVTEGLAIVKVIDVVVTIIVMSMRSLPMVLVAASVAIITVVVVSLSAQLPDVANRPGKLHLEFSSTKIGTIGVVQCHNNRGEYHHCNKDNHETAKSREDHWVYVRLV